MNQSIDPQRLQSLAPAYKDRDGWLIAFGVLEILIACFFLLMAVMMGVLVPTMPKPAGQPPMPGSFFYLLAAMYAAVAVFFVTVGVGSIRAKNWARIAMVVTSSLWLGVGVLSTISTLFLMPRLLQQQRAAMPPAQASQLPPNFEGIFLVGFGIFTVSIMVLLPLVLLLFYSSKSVKGTCWARSGIVSSARRLAIPVVVLIGWFSFSALSSLVVAAWFPMIALFGFIVHGAAARVIGVAFSLVSAYCAWNMYKLRVQGWMVALIAFGTWFVSGVITRARLDPMTLVEETYKYMGVTPQQLPGQNLDPQSLNLFWGLGVLFSGTLVGLTLYAKRYFKPDQRRSKGLATGA